MIDATLETLYMTGVSMFASYLLGLPLGIISNETRKSGLYPNVVIHAIVEFIIGLGRAIPFTILMVLALPLTRLLVGTGVGTTATIVPLTLAATPFVARLVSISLNQVEREIVEAAKIDGASKFKIIFKISIGSRLFDIIEGMGTSSVAIVSYTAISGTLGGGGLGNYAITKGYYQYDWLSVALATGVIVAIVILLQWVFRLISKAFDWR